MSFELGDRVVIDPQKVKTYCPERASDLEDFYTIRYKVVSFPSDQYVQALPVGGKQIYPDCVLLERSILRHAPSVPE